MKRVMLAAMPLLMAGGVATAQTAPATSVELPSTVRFVMVRQQAQLAEATAKVIGPDGRPMFTAAQDYIFQTYNSTDGQIVEWDRRNGRVRISPDGQPEAWLACADLKPMSIACNVEFGVKDGRVVITPATHRAGSRTSGTRGFSVSRSATPQKAPTMPSYERGLPACPGDPRCPRG